MIARTVAVRTGLGALAFTLGTTIVLSTAPATARSDHGSSGGEALVVPAADEEMPTTISVTSAPTSVAVRDTITITVAVETSLSPKPSSGQVLFTWDNLLGGTGSYQSVVEGVAAVVIPGEIGAGDHVITATYLPPSGYASSQVDIPVTVSLRPTQTTLSVSPSEVAMSVSGDGRPVYGEFDMLLNGQPWHSGSGYTWPQPKSLADLPPGTYNVTARFLEGQPYGPAPSDRQAYAPSQATATFTIAAAPPVTTPVVAPPTSHVAKTTTATKVAKKIEEGKPVKVQVIVTSDNGLPVAGKARLVVVKPDGKKLSKTLAVKNGKATVRLTKLPVGKYRATTEFKYGPNALGSLSRTVTFKVTK